MIKNLFGLTHNNSYNIFPLREFLTKTEFKKKLDGLSKNSNISNNKLYDIMLNQLL